MRPSKITPRVHVFVCANRRADAGLGPGCGDHGDAVYEAMKREVGARGLVQQAWVTKTHCLGICPKKGATVAVYAAPDDPLWPIVTEVGAGDVPGLVARLAQANAPPPAVDLAQVTRELDDMEELQTRKVLDLARRLKVGMTNEDVQNPHDFPELSDPDWQYADGVRAGIASAKSALAALVARARSRSGAPESNEPE